MKRKYILGGAIIALLMLMSTTFFISVPNVKGADAKQGDLIPLQGQLLAWPPYGGYYRFEVRVKNIGTKTTPAGHDTELIWDGSQSLGSYEHTVDLANGEVDTGYIYFYAPSKGRHTITVVADCNDEKSEEDETNNDYLKSYYFWWIG